MEDTAKSSDSASLNKPQDAKKDSTLVAEFISGFKLIVIFLFLAIILRGTLIEPYRIPSGSMIPTLRIGDHILVSKLSYGLRLPFVAETLYRYSEPKHGAVVVFTRPDDPQTEENESKDNIVKRVVAVGGDTIEVRGNSLIRNGEVVDEPYARWELGGDPRGNFGPAVVPAGHVFVIGDNRDHSKDARHWRQHFLPLERIKGRALFIYWSWDDLSRISKAVR